jgi:hypothetical protein
MPAVPGIFRFRPHAAHGFGPRQPARLPGRYAAAHPTPPSRPVVAGRASGGAWHNFMLGIIEIRGLTGLTGLIRLKPTDFLGS